MGRRGSEGVYNRLFTVVKEEMQDRGLTFSPRQIVTDFEIGQILSLLLQFTGAEVLGCYFHINQCLSRWVLRKGFSALCGDRDAFYSLDCATADLTFVQLDRVGIVWIVVR